MVARFEDINPTLDNYWRAIILFGRNVASYKFALAKSLLELNKSSGELVRLHELADPFSRYMCEHLAQCDKQATSSSSQYLDKCRAFNNGELDKTTLIEQTVRLGFVNVIDAFHVVNQSEIPVRFFDDVRKSDKAIRLTDNIFKLFDTASSVDLPNEVEARWRLVETAWDMNISRNLITVQYDNDAGLLYANRNNRRTNITSSRDALNGYQKGKCFYCYDDISILEGQEPTADVDHFFPHTLKGQNIGEPVDGVWNLVLACKACNRGENGKFARLPDLTLLERLNRRNNYLISSHHPLRETLIQQTGKSEQVRQAFLQDAYIKAKQILIHTWLPEPKGTEEF